MSAPAQTPLATLEQVAEWLQIPVDKLMLQIRRGEFPKPIKLSRKAEDWRYAWPTVHNHVRTKMGAHGGK